MNKVDPILGDYRQKDTDIVFVQTAEPERKVGNLWEDGTTPAASSKHSELTELDYAHAGHTGFQPAGSYLTAETDPVFSASEAAEFVEGDKEKLDNQSGTNTGDETATTIKSKLGITVLSGDNTGDQTLPVKCSGAEITTGTDDAKFATAKALKDAGINLPIGYTVPIYSGNLATMVSGSTYYVGSRTDAFDTNATRRRVYIPRTGTIKIAYVFAYSNTAGTNENISVYVRLNNTTDTLIATVGLNANARLFSNTALSIAVSQGDYIEIKVVCPTWSSAPLNATFNGHLYIE